LKTGFLIKAEESGLNNIFLARGSYFSFESLPSKSSSSLNACGCLNYFFGVELLVALGEFYILVPVSLFKSSLYLF